MSLIVVDSDKCKRDGMCAAVCPRGIVELGPDGLPGEVNPDTCIACGHCVAVCPHGALQNAKVDMAAMIPVAKDRPGPEALRGLMLSRRSIRAYKDEPVARGDIEALLDTARHAPTAVNFQKVYWIACTDSGRTKQAAGAAMDWLRGAGIYPSMVEAWDQGREVVMRGAPAFVAAYSPSDYAWGETDCVIALSYLELAAASAGLGACWAGLLTRAAQNHPPLAALLGVPEGHVVHGALMLGHPKFKYRMVPPRNPARTTWL